MKGLLIKDVKIILLQKKFFFLLLLVTVGLLISSEDIAFPLGFFPGILSLFALTTISYDELDNGEAFLFTLPITRRMYVMEKYGLGLLLIIPSLLVTTVSAAMISWLKGNLQLSGLFLFTVLLFPVFLMIQALMFPVQLKYGAEKGRIVLMGGMGLLMFLAMGLKALLKNEWNQLFQGFSIIPMKGLLVFWLLSGGLLFFLSMKWSVVIMEQKEF